MTPRDKLIEAMAEELWQSDSERAAGRRRRVPWSEASDTEHNVFLGYATRSLAVIEAHAGGCVVVPVTETVQIALGIVRAVEKSRITEIWPSALAASPYAPGGKP